MVVSYTGSGGVQVIHVQGGAVSTIEDCDQVWRILRGLLMREHKQMVLDLTGCPAVAEDVRRYWSEVLLRVSDNYRGKLAILNPPDDLTEWMERVGARSVTPWFYRLDEAVAAIRQQTST